tara:strand:- start:2661 stop:3077 length:417 start_codon:yes stop_codon:yes gene_type:complete
MIENINKVHSLEQATVLILNTFDGWELEWTGQGYSSCDAMGKTPKGLTCAMEMKFRNKYYETKMLEKKKYDLLMSIDVQVHLYWVGDIRGNYMYWLDDIEMPEPTMITCASTTLWQSDMKTKPVYMLSEDMAIQKNVY